MFQRKIQETNLSLATYVTEFNKCHWIQSKKYESEKITLDEILRDRIVNGMTIGNWRQRLLDKENLKLVDVIKSPAHAQSETLKIVATKVC